MRRILAIVLVIGCGDKPVEPPKPAVEQPKPAVEQPKPIVAATPSRSPDGTMQMPGHPDLLVTVPDDVKLFIMVDNVSVTGGADDFAIVFTPAPAKTLAQAKDDLDAKLVVSAKELPDGWTIERRFPDRLNPKMEHDLLIEMQRKIGSTSYRCTVTAYERKRIAALRDICTSIRPAKP